MFKFFLVVHALVAAALVGVILMQRSEGGGFTQGSPTGLMSARGAGDFLTRTTTILATLFITLSIGLAALATVNRRSAELDTSLVRPAVPVAAPAVPLAGQNPAGNSAAPVLAPSAGNSAQ